VYFQWEEGFTVQHPEGGEFFIFIFLLKYQASVISGHFSDGKAHIKAIAPRAVYINCHAHKLNLVLGCSIQNLR